MGQAMETLSLPLPTAAKDIAISARLGSAEGRPGRVTLRMILGAGRRVELNLRSEDFVRPNGALLRSLNKRGIRLADDFPERLKDACIRIELDETAHWGSRVVRKYFVRPDPRRYPPEMQPDLISRWETSPGSTEHPFRLRVGYDGETVRFEIDGRYVAGTKLDDRIKEMRLDLHDGARVERTELVEPLLRGRHLAVDLGRYARPGRLNVVGVSLPPGLQEVEGVPVNVAPAVDRVDVSQTRLLRVADTQSLYYDPYYRRTPLDGVPETIMFRLPRAWYNRAYVLCAVDPDAGKDPVLCTRLSRFFGRKRGRGNAIAEGRADLSSPDRPCARRVGKATVTDADGRDRDLPLYLARVFLNAGEISDLIEMEGLEDQGQGDQDPWGWTTDYLDLELSGELMDYMPHSPGASNFGRRPLGRPSGVILFGLTLESLPFELRVRSDEPGNLLYRDRDPALRLETRNRTDATHQWTIRYRIDDYNRRICDAKSDVFTVPPGDARCDVDLSGLSCGWYAFAFELLDERRRTAWRETRTFVLLPPDTRKAGDESPFGTWWNKCYHLGEGRLGIVGPIYRKLGVRHTIGTVVEHAFFGRNYSVKELRQYGVTPGFIGSLRLIDRQRILPKPLNEADVRAEVEGKLARLPGVKRALVFHEHRLNHPEELRFPPELLGQAPRPLPPVFTERARQFAENALLISKVYRDLAPDVKLYHGNTFRTGFVYQVYLRNRFPKQYVDALSLEHSARPQYSLPEEQPSTKYELWVLREMMRLHGYDDVRLAATFENIGVVSDPIKSSEHDQARLTVRQMLFALAYGLDAIHAGMIHDAGNAYYYTGWGSTGMCHRKPRLTPKPCFAAVATLTQVLDCAEYRGCLPCASPTVFCLRFEREAERVYVLWTVRGGRAVTLTTESDCAVQRIDLVGARCELKTSRRRLRIDLTPDPTYLVMPAALVAVKPGEPMHEPPRFGGLATVAALSSAADWAETPGPDPDFEKLDETVPRRRGAFRLETARDPARGDCLQITLLPQNDLPAVCPRYVTLQPTQTITFPPQTKRVGVWVKGNSCWGRILIDLYDAEGQRWTLTDDPKCETFINFDGWRFLHVPLPSWTPSGHAGPHNLRWTCVANDVPRGPGAHPPTPQPIRLARVIVEMRDHVVHVTELQPVPSPTIRLNALTAVTE